MRRGDFLLRLSVLFLACTITTEVAAYAREWTDVTGKFKVEAELVAIRSGKVILEKPDGSILTVPLERLSAADQEYLKSQSRPASSDTPSPASASSASAPGQTAPPPSLTPNSAASATGEDPALAEKALAVLRANCYRCHGEDGSSEGGFNFVLNLEKLGKTVVKPRNLGGSLLWERISAKDESVMPPEGDQPRPSATDIATIRDWVESGAPAVAVAAKPREFISNEAIVKYILADVQKAGERSRRFLRYFTLAHLYNAGVSDDEVQTYRNAFNKLINSLSWNRDLIIPEAIDPAKTVFRIDIRLLNWSNEQWEQIEAANPYFLALDSADAMACNEATQTKMPYVRIDWFVFAASKPPLYHAVLAVPDSDEELEKMLHVNVEANISQEKALRAAFNRSGVSQHNRLIEWHRSPYGSYWKSYDFGGSAGRQNLFEYPLGPGNGDDSFQHDGGEIIFTLPNGLQGYLLVDGSGKRIDQGPTNIVSDPKQLDRTVTNGVSCMSCHYTGVIPKTDEIGGAVRANPKAFENSADILAIYRPAEELNRVFDEDGKRFAAALEKIGITSLSRSGESVSAMALRFQQELDLAMAASEFGLTPDEFLTRLDHAVATARALGPLRVPGGTIKRDVFVKAFSEAAAELGLVGDASPTLAAATISSQPLGKQASSSPSLARPSTSALAKLPASDANKPGDVRRFSDLIWGVDSLAFSPSGVYLAAGKPDRALWLFDIPQGARLQTLERLEMLQSVKICAFTPNGSRLLAGGRSGHVQIFDVSKEGLMKEGGQFVGHSRELSCIAVSNDGRFAVSGGHEKKLRYWEIDTGRELGAFAGFEGPVKACFIARNGRTAMATDSKTLLFIDLTRREVTRQRELARSWAAGQAAAFSPNGDHVAVGDGYNIRMWNLNSTGEKPPLEDNEIQWSMTFTPDGTRLISGGNGKVNVWDVRKSRKIHAQSLDETGYVKCVAAAPDNKHAAAIASRDIQVFRLPPPEK